MTDPTITGACLCGGVRFTYAGPLGGELGAVTVCHCVQCRKAHGYAVGVVPVRAAGLAFTEGRALICEYQSSPGKHRAFCSVCGSPLYSRREAAPEALRLRLGLLDDPPASLTVEAHIFTALLPAWAEPDDAPRYPEFEPERFR